MSKYFYHGVDNVETACQILMTGGIKSRRKLGHEDYYGFNRLDYVSLCRPGRPLEYDIWYDNAYEMSVLDEFVFIISDDIDAIEPDLLDSNEIFAPNMKQYLESHPNQICSSLFDEWLIRDQVPLSKIIGLGIPMDRVEQQEFAGDEQKQGLQQLLMLADALGLDIVDSSDFAFVRDYEKKKRKGEKVKELSIGDMVDPYE